MRLKVAVLAVITASLISWVAIASAATGAYTGESKAPQGKLCHYDVQGSDRTVNIPSYAMCPRSREFPATPPAESTNTAPPTAVRDAGAVKAGYKQGE